MERSNGKTVIVLGGGVGGVVTAVEVRRLLPSRHRVILIEREARHLFAPSLLWLMTGLRSAEKISRPLDRLRSKGIEVVRGEIGAIDAASRTVEVNGAALVGDHVVIALGAELAPEAIPGLAEGGHDFYTLDGAESLRQALRGFGGGRLAVLTATAAYKCPAAPYEAAMLLEYDCRKRRIRERVQIDMYAAEAAPMAVTGAEMSASVRSMVEDKDIAYHPGYQVTKVDAAARSISFADGAEARYDLLAFVPPHRAPRVVRDAGLAQPGGWVAVDEGTLATRFEGVYAIGDVNGIPLMLGKPLPKAGTFAHSQAQVVARNIAASITGRGETVTFDGRGECFIEAGDGRAGFARGEFYAQPIPRMKRFAAGRHWHAGKVLFERDWLRRWF